MITRIAKLGDLEVEVLKRLGPQFYPKFDIGVFCDAWSKVLASGIGSMWAYQITHGETVGFLGAVLSPCIFSGETIATEAFWFIDPSYRGGTGGVRLFDTFLDWAEEVGADRIVTAHVMNANSEGLERFYKRHAFVELERTFMREAITR